MCEKKNFNVEFYVISCGRCGIVFAITSTYDRRLRESHKTFYCPNGCHRHYPHESAKEALARKNAELRDIVDTEREETRACKATMVSQAFSIRAHKSASTKAKRKIAELSEEKN